MNFPRESLKRSKCLWKNFSTKCFSTKLVAIRSLKLSDTLYSMAQFPLSLLDLPRSCSAHISSSLTLSYLPLILWFAQLDGFERSVRTRGRRRVEDSIWIWRVHAFAVVVMSVFFDESVMTVEYGILPFVLDSVCRRVCRLLFVNRGDMMWMSARK
jgi:hypothetical protein